MVFDGGRDYLDAGERASGVWRDRYERVSTRPSIVGDSCVDMRPKPWADGSAKMLASLDAEFQLSNIIC